MLVGSKGGAIALPPRSRSVKFYADLAETVQAIAEEQRMSVPPEVGARAARHRFDLSGDLL